ncbi:MAG: hypothetical protein AAF553_01370 [Pseudomonadota bacterium]
MRTTILSLAALTLATSAAAQSSPSQSDTPAPSPAPAETSPLQTAQSEILVEGDRERRRTINAYIADIMEEESSGQYARFDAPICPSFSGFSENVVAFMEQRVRDVAKAADVKAAEPGCKGNVLVRVVEDGPATINTMRARHKGAFGTMLPYERRKIAEGQGPAYVWHLVTSTGADDGSNRDEPGAGLSNDFGGDGGAYSMLSSDMFKTGKSNTKSLILQPVRQAITHAFVLIEEDAALGLSPLQIADYAAVMALARSSGDTEAARRVSTIRALFDTPRDEAPELLSDWDLALLKSLYAAQTNLRAGQQRSAMTRMFEKTLVENESEGENDPG